MNSKKTKTLVAIATVILLIAGCTAVNHRKHTRAAAPETTPQADEITAAVNQINQVNVGRPDLQIQAKALIFAAMIQKHIPPAAKWCDNLNVGGKLWPVTPTNTYFVINTQIAGRAYSRTNPLPGTVVVFFEAAKPGWNLAGGPDLVANNPEGVAVAFADGRAVIVPPTEVAKLRWVP